MPKSLSLVIVHVTFGTKDRFPFIKRHTALNLMLKNTREPFSNHD